MKLKKALPVLLSVLLLCASVLFTAHLPQRSQTESPHKRENSAGIQRIPKEIRGVWVTYMALDVENEADRETAFDKKIDAVIRDMQSGGFNTMIVQVRPFCDAIYSSKLFPWSHIISGTQGVDPGFDPLGHIVEKCRANGIFIHAWINPYRVATENTPPELSADNPYVRDASVGAQINGCRYLNPASKAAQRLIADGVRELAESYDIDGIQFDDYFYPESCGDFDRADYERYLAESGEQLTIDEFRRNNVSNMVAAAYEAAHDAKENLIFGISPQGNLANNDLLYADVRGWCAEEGYVDYICPQIYFSPDNPALTYEDCLQEWLSLKKHEGLKLLIGLAGYKAGTDADEGTWLDNDDILKTEVEILRSRHADGFLLYSSESFHDEDNQAEMENLIRYLTTAAVQ